MEEEAEEAGPERQRLGRGAAGGLERQRPLEKGAGDAAGGPERQRLGRGAAGVEEGAEEAGPERQQVCRRGQQLGRGAAAMEERDEEAGPERQQMGRRGSSLAGEQQPWRKGMRKQGRRGSRWAGEAAA